MEGVWEEASETGDDGMGVKEEEEAEPQRDARRMNAASQDKTRGREIIITRLPSQGSAAKCCD